LKRRVCTESAVSFWVWLMAKAPAFKRLLAHPIEPTGDPQVLLVTLEDAAKSVGLMEHGGRQDLTGIAARARS